MEEKPARLLIVEDDPDIREMLCEVFARSRYEIVSAENGREALEAVASTDLDVVLLDVALPGMDGFEILSKIRHNQPPTRLPIIMLTGMTERNCVVKALKLGANDYVTKPLDLPIVLARLQTQLSLKRAVDQSLRLELDLARRNQQLQVANEELGRANGQMKSDLASAARVQRALLPTCLPAVPGIEFAYVYQPCEELGGDILNVFTLDDDHVGLYLLDVSGHGVRAALLSVALSRLLAPLPDQPCLVRRRAGGVGRFEPTPPLDLAQALNERFQIDDRAEQYFTMFYGVLNTHTLELRYVCAGQPGPLYVPREGPAVDLSEPVLAIGWVPDPGYRERTLTLKPGDRLYICSDGIDEARNSEKEPFGLTRIADAMRRGRETGLHESLDALVETAARWSGHPFEDDVSGLALEVRMPLRPAPPQYARPVEATV